MLAVVFPGQGSQQPDMRDRVAAVRPDLLDALVKALGEDPFPRVDEGTRWAQPAIFAASLAAWSERPADASAPTWAAGHSLGELTALTVTGALEESDAVDLVALRGRLMQEAGPGGMVALLGQGAAEAAPEIAAAHDLSVANDNAPQQVVLSGARENLEPAATAASEAGVRATILPVAGAFHSPLMEPAHEPFRQALQSISVRPPRIPVFSCVTAGPIDDVRATLADGILKPVRWRETVLALHAAGAQSFEEVGPGRVLAGLIKRIVP
ncbi:MAG TPA: ACP S-malonyltransferase, partial [Solirubrobacteraceae bacterium]